MVFSIRLNFLQEIMTRFDIGGVGFVLLGKQNRAGQNSQTVVRMRGHASDLARAL
jgi:hypothetical protein